MTNEHVAFALGVGRRALDALLDLAQSKQRGYGQRSTLATRPAVHRLLGESDLRLRAARTLAIESYEKAWVTVCRRGRTLLALLRWKNSSATEYRHLCYGRRCGGHDAGVSLQRWVSAVFDECAPTVSARHQRGSATPDGE